MTRMIRQERIKRGWSINYVAEKTRLSNEAIRLIETEERPPSYSVLVKLEDLFHMNHRKLFSAVALDTIRDAMRKEKAAGELHLHSDQGFQYTSHAYFSLTKECGVTPSMSRRAPPYDNAMAENFFSILKAECINRHKLFSFFQARSLIDDFIWFYSNERIRLKSKLTPLQKRRQLL